MTTQKYLHGLEVESVSIRCEIIDGGLKREETDANRTDERYLDPGFELTKLMLAFVKGMMRRRTQHRKQ